MARQFHGIEKGIDIYAENGALQVRLLSGTAAPTGTGDQASAPIGSLYVRSGTGELYQKIANAAAPADWELNGSSSAGLGNWRPERVDAHTGQVLSAGVTDPTGWSDNDGGFDGTDATVGHYVLDGNCDLWEITVVGGASSITLAAAASAPSADDMFAVKFNLPDPAGQENQAIIIYDGAACIKVADVDFANASGITVDAGYTPASGNPVAGDSVLSALQKLDGNNDAQDSVLGTSQGATDLGTFTGSTISDNGSVKAGMQELETAHETLSSSVTEIDGNVDDLITLSGVAENSTDLGTFTGVTIPDSSTNKGALQSLETAYEETDQNVDDLITLSGVAENSTDHGTMDQGDILSDASTSNALFKETDAELTRQRGKVSASGVTAIATVDSVLVDSVSAVNYEITIEDAASPANKAHFRLFAGHDGHAGADAVSVDDTVGKILKLNSAFNYSVSVDLNGAAGAQVMRLRVASTEGSGVNVYAKRTEVLF